MSLPRTNVLLFCLLLKFFFPVTFHETGTRTFGALPEFVYSTSMPASDPTTVYVNLLVPSVYQGSGFKLVQSTGFPSNGTISIAMHRDPIAIAMHTRHSDDATQQVMLRIPSWCQTETVPVTVCNSLAQRSCAVSLLFACL
jgi:DUF1680 family protein